MQKIEFYDKRLYLEVTRNATFSARRENKGTPYNEDSHFTQPVNLPHIKSLPRNQTWWSQPPRVRAHPFIAPRNQTPWNARDAPVRPYTHRRARTQVCAEISPRGWERTQGREGVTRSESGNRVWRSSKLLSVDQIQLADPSVCVNTRFTPPFDPHCLRV